MARHHYVILSQPIAGRETEFEAWYDSQHLGDVCKIAGVVGAKRFRISSQKATGLDAPAWTSLAIYEIEDDDPQAVAAAISAAAGSPAMPLSDAMDRQGLVQIIAQEVTAISPTRA